MSRPGLNPRVSLSALLVCLSVLSISAAWGAPAAQVTDPIPMPDDLQPITVGNAGQVSEVLVIEPRDFDAPHVGFEGALAGNSDWARAVTIMAALAGLQGASFSTDYAVGATPLVDDVKVDSDMSAANPVTTAQNLHGDYTDLYTSAISPDASTLAVGDLFGLAVLWDLETREEVVQWQAHSEILVTVLFTPDGSQLVTLGWEANSETIGLWDPHTGEAIRKIDSPYPISSGAFNPDGSLLAVGGPTIALWDFASGEPIAEMDAHSEGVSALAFSPDGSLLATGSQDGTIYLWDVATATEVGALMGQIPEDESLGNVDFLSFSPDGALLVSSNAEGLLHFWGTTADPGAAPMLEPAATEATEAAAETLDEAPTESAAEIVCSLTAISGTNLRGGPGTTFDRAGSLAAGQMVEADGQTEPGDGFIWYRLTTGAWVRADLVTAAAECADLEAVVP